MSGRILTLARRDAKRHIKSGGFEEDITLISSGASPQTLNTTGYHAKHHINFDTEGNAVNAISGHVTVDEQILIDASYPYKNSIGEVHMIGHRVNVQDSTGNVFNYIVRENRPDSTLGLITLILGNYIV